MIYDKDNPMSQIDRSNSRYSYSLTSLAEDAIPVGTKVWINGKTYGMKFDLIFHRGGSHPDKDIHGRYVGWVLKYKDDEDDIHVVVYNSKSQFGGDYYRVSDLEVYDHLDLLPEELFEI